METNSYSDASDTTSSQQSSSSSSHGDDHQTNQVPDQMLAQPNQSLDDDDGGGPSSSSSPSRSSSSSSPPEDATTAVVVTTSQQPLFLTTITEQCDDDNGRRGGSSDDNNNNNTKNKTVEPTTTPSITKENPPSSPINQLPLSRIIHFSADDVGDDDDNNHNSNNKAIINLQRQIQEYNMELLGKGDRQSISSMSLPHHNQNDNLCGTIATSSTSESTNCLSNRRSLRSEPANLYQESTTPICNIDELSDDVGGGSKSEYILTTNDPTIGVNPSDKANHIKAVKRLESSRSVSKQTGVGLSFFRKKFQSLTFRRKQGDFLSNQAAADLDFTNQIKGSYKKTSAQAIVAAIQLGIAYSVGKFSAKPDRDILLQDFFQLEEVYFPSCGTTYTPSHRFADFTMTDHSPVAFRYFRDIFSISPEDFMTSLSTRPLRQLSNPGASGSMFFVSEDDIFIIKTVDKREAKFLQQLLPGYYMNLHQNPKTLLPKFFGLYSYRYSGRNIRLVVMNNLMPSRLQFHEKYDLKGSTFKRKASQKERSKVLPTLKDLDFMEKHPNGFELSQENHQRLMKTLQRDIRVLQSYKIMDYSLLLCVHNKAIYEKNKLEHYRKLQANLTKSTDITIEAPSGPTSNVIDEESALQNNPSAQLFNDLSNDNSFDIDEFLKNGIPAKNSSGEDLILFVGIIDILQNYRLIKRTEHNLKAMVHDRDSISVHNPVFYAERFISFCSSVFRVVNKSTTTDTTPLARASTTKSPQQSKMIHPVSSASQPIIGVNDPDNPNPPIEPPTNTVNKFIDNI